MSSLGSIVEGQPPPHTVLEAPHDCVSAQNEEILNIFRRIQDGQKDLEGRLSRIEHLLKANEGTPTEAKGEEGSVNRSSNTGICPACEGLPTGKTDETGYGNPYKVSVDH